LVVHHPAGLPGLGGCPSPIPAGATPREVPQEGSQGQLVVTRDRRGETLGRAGLAGEATGPALRDPELPLEDRDGLPAAVRGQKFPRFSSFNMSMSSVWSATRRLRRAFSRSNSLSLLASSAFMPPYWLRQRCQVDSVISRWRATSSRFFPSPRSFSPSVSLRITCSGVCLRRFTLRSSSPHFGASDSHYVWLISRGSGHSALWRRGGAGVSARTTRSSSSATRCVFSNVSSMAGCDTGPPLGRSLPR